jgi:DNA-binding SARP family transcriptional activator
MFTMLGRMAVTTADDRAIRIPAGKQQAILAVLALCPGVVLTTDRLIAELWQDEPPATARVSFQTYVYRLRRALAPLSEDGVDLATLGQGYTLIVPDHQVDVRTFEASVASGTDALIDGDPGQAAKQLGDALAMWRGPLAPEIDVEFVRHERRRLDELWLSACELRAEARLRLGHDNHVIVELEQLVLHHPFRESSWAMLMRALAGRGRRAEALNAYRRMHAILSDELGVEPADDVRRLHQDILHGTVDRQHPRRARAGA